MKHIKHIVSASLAALLLASCGGGGGGSASSNSVGFTQIASFGDSLSDAGSFAVGSVALLGGGRYTINSGSQAAPSKIWLDLISTQLGLPAPCAAVKGLNSRAPFGAPVARTTQTGCTNYAQGGSRVINPVGPANTALPDSAGGAVGQLTEPVTTQISNYLAANGGAFGAKTLVTVLAGGNDIFMNGAAVTAAINNFSPNMTTTQAAVGAAVIAGWSNGMDALAGTLAAGGTTATNAAIAQAVATMSAAGTTLADQIKTQIVGKGAKYVLVLNLPDVSSSPYGIENPTAAPLVNQMVQAFNASLTAGLSGVSGVVIGDAYTTSRDQFSNPSAYAASNSRNRACKRAPDNALDGASLVCNPTNVIAGDVSKYLFADDVHPTPYGHQLLAQFASKVLATAGWL
jgi:outer membrane lipase/esterase